MSSRGHDRERRVAELLRQDDWWVCRAAGSLGDADLVALRVGNTPRLVEVKSTARGPFSHMPPVKRNALRAAAAIAGAEAWLAWWPSRGTLKWIPEAQWPT